MRAPFIPPFTSMPPANTPISPWPPNTLLGGGNPPPLAPWALNTLLGGYPVPPPPNTLRALTLLGGGNALLTAPPPPLRWQYVTERFKQLLGNLAITKAQTEDGDTAQAGVRSCLNRYYYGNSSETDNSMLIGSWGKHTRVRPPRDVDVLFLPPAHVYHRFQQRLGNRQSALLQEVKNVLAATYPKTDMHADRHVVVVPFDRTAIEVAVGFRCQDSSIIVCDAKGNGTYKTSTAEAELADLAASDAVWNGNTRALARMMKQWQRERNVPIKSFCLERLAIEFLGAWPYSRYGLFWYDWMVRDFLGHLVRRAGGYLVMPGAGEIVGLGDAWLSRAETAYRHAVSACENERDNYEVSAGNDWQEIFGSAVPWSVS